MGEASVLGRTSEAGLLVTHSSSEPELLLSESDESLHEDPDELPPLVEDPDELLELRLLLGAFCCFNKLLGCNRACVAAMSTSSSSVIVSWR